MTDTQTYGSFTHSFLSRFRDDFTKLSCISFPILSGYLPGQFDADDARSVKKALNDALLLQSLSELSTLTVPIQPSTTWASGAWCDALNLNVRLFSFSSLRDLYIEEYIA